MKTIRNTFTHNWVEGGRFAGFSCNYSLVSITHISRLAETPETPEDRDPLDMEPHYEWLDDLYGPIMSSEMIFECSLEDLDERYSEMNHLKLALTCLRQIEIAKTLKVEAGIKKLKIKELSSLLSKPANPKKGRPSSK